MAYDERFQLQSLNLLKRREDRVISVSIKRLKGIFVLIRSVCMIDRCKVTWAKVPHPSPTNTKTYLDRNIYNMQQL